MLFWIVSIALASAIGAALLRALARGGAASAPSRDADMGIYRDQLAEVERDLQRGVIAETEAERARIEISRRILDADRAGVTVADEDGPAAESRLALVAIIACALLAAPLAYVGTATMLRWSGVSEDTVSALMRRYEIIIPIRNLDLRLSPFFEGFGAPGYADLPISERIARAEAFREARPSQAAAEAKVAEQQTPKPDPAFAELMERLREAVAANPGDLTGQQLLARNEAALGNYSAAAAAQTQLIALSGDRATAQDYAALADLMILATDGYVSPEAEQALAEALARDPKNGTARFYMGLMWAQTGRPDHAFDFWRALLEQGPEEAPWMPTIREQIGMLARAAGVDYTPPAPTGSAPGPDAADVAAAAEMSDADRNEMIRGMVDRLSERLASDGGPAEDWARLITALGVLGEKDRARRAWEEARGQFEGQETETALLRAAAEEAGVAE